MSCEKQWRLWCPISSRQKRTASERGAFSSLDKMEGLSWHVCIKMSRQLTGGGGMVEGGGSLCTICRRGHKLRSATWETYRVWFTLKDKQHAAEPGIYFPPFFASARSC